MLLQEFLTISLFMEFLPHALQSIKTNMLAQIHTVQVAVLNTDFINLSTSLFSKTEMTTEWETCQHYWSLYHFCIAEEIGVTDSKQLVHLPHFFNLFPS